MYKCKYMEWDVRRRMYACPYKEERDKVYNEMSELHTKPVAFHPFPACPSDCKKDEQGNAICYVIGSDT